MKGDKCVQEYYIRGQSGHLVFQIFSVVAFLMTYCLPCALFTLLYGKYNTFHYLFRPQTWTIAFVFVLLDEGGLGILLMATKRFTFRIRKQQQIVLTLDLSKQAFSSLQALRHSANEVLIIQTKP